ncbi:MAG TPA: N-acetylmuramoyl-L-alanine amidase-like domain-containing protein [Patescibacteria group bacterium]|nr:N-acetylmuramoyl-L-alanine amidase-like domain-containing protein [Gammaproteobacteria bacterium]HWA51493.1 N-acetylmuramoyl-L-alanine amidase-like domain-containing protein [Patescibacteria group bacterium]
MTYQKVDINGITCKLELGKWTIDSLENDLIIAQWKFKLPFERIKFLAEQLISTPFYFESELPILPKQWLRVRFESFDCVTFLYTVIALSSSISFSDFCQKLCKVRYKFSEDFFLDNDPKSGNIFDFVEESILYNCIKRNYLDDITQHLISQNKLIEIKVKIKPVTRPAAHDSKTLIITPKYLQAYEARWDFIPTSSLSEIDIKYLNSGDIILLSKGEKDSQGQPAISLISHLAIVIKENNELFFIHSSKNYIVDLNIQKNDPIHQQIGVNYGLKFAGDHYTQKVGNKTYYGYLKEQKQSLITYAENNFKGACFLRAK